MPSKKKVAFDKQMEERQTEQSGYSGSLDLNTLQGLADLKNQGKGAIVQALSTNSLQRGAFRFTSRGLQVNGEISLEDWQEVGKVLSFLNTSMQFLIGDWARYGENLGYGTHEKFAEQFGFETQTIYNFKWVSENVQISLRKENLKFGHHNLVAAMESEQQAYWLDYASDNELSVAKLREAIKSSKQDQLPTRLDSFTTRWSESKLEKELEEMTDEERRDALAYLRSLLRKFETI